ncbi:MAG: cupin domain-containing protein [Candidatus Izimaplasma sp.]|nr:cupin domain-containing protein [Candidatus Izimaplasma bacterium]
MINHKNNIVAKEIKNDQVKNITMKVLLSNEDGWKDHVMREFEVKKDGHTTKHQHPWFHVNYVLEGEGELLLNGSYQKLTKGSVAFVPANKEHQFRNTKDEPFRFICIVPNKGHKI